MKIVDGTNRISASDLANFLACRHLTRLDLLRARAVLEPPRHFDIGFQALMQRGLAHEAAVLDHLRADGLTVVEIEGEPNAETARLTSDALRGGADVVYQGVLLREGANGEVLLGLPDFLVRADILPAPDGESRLEYRHHEVVDAKLARSAKARAVLQATFYTHLLADVQGIEPRWMHLALGNGEFASFKVKDFAAYERQTRRLLRHFVDEDPGDNPPSDPYPDPVEHCAICRWSPTCVARRRSDDDLSLVAGMTKRQRQALKGTGVVTRRDFAGLVELPDLERVGHQSLERAQLQARLQVASEDDRRVQYELLVPERDKTGALVPNRGLLALPKPAVGDLFFDIEGARYYSEDGREFGLQYLFGIVDTADVDPEGKARYTQIWSFDRLSEKRGFEGVIDFITERRARNPGLHVYHYNHYEPTSIDHLTALHETREEAVGRLMGRFATREDEVDDLFRLGVFTDLYRVVRQGLRAGVESYSIKSLEPLCGYTRRIDLREVTAHLIALEAALEDGTALADPRRQEMVAGYNEDDCRAALALRDWLELRRADLGQGITEELPRPVVEEEAHATENLEVTRIRSALLAGIPDDLSQRTADEQARSLMADLLDWHRREAKPAWWRYFYVRTLSGEELIDEPHSLGGLAGGEVVDTPQRSVVHRFSFPPQEHGFTEGGKGLDPATGKEWTVWSLDDDRQRIDLKIGRASAGTLPTALVEGGPVDTRHLAARLRDLGDRIGRDGMAGRDAATALLLRARPTGDDLGAGVLRRRNESPTDAAVRLALALHDSYLPIQGPPGTGKTFIGAEQILGLIAEGRTVGITGPSHAVIHNLISEVLKHAEERASKPRIGQRADEDNPFLHRGASRTSYDQLERALRERQLDIGAGTIWTWSRQQFHETVDTLVVDEAGQMSLANVLAVAGAARNLILLGDPQQLAQPSHAEHPPGAGASPLEHILGQQATMPLDAGLLIDRTRRMHPDLCSYTSEVFYDGKLGWVEGLERQVILAKHRFSGSGLRVVEVPHEGNTNESREEAAEVASIVAELLGAEWRDEHGEQVLLTAAAVLVVTPYNAQIAEIEEQLAAAGHADVRVGTVDKFQGREAAVVIYSMATSSAEDAPRGMEFLYDLHRLNVATSRARAMAIVVASPDLVRVFCGTPRQMVLANALCRLWERPSIPASAPRVAGS